jgi:ribosome-binding protein aMBF1 (putative translation factor)
MTHRCVICGDKFDAETGVVIGHPVEMHVCGACFDSEITPLFEERNFSSARPTEAPCLASWAYGDTRVGVEIPTE